MKKLHLIAFDIPYPANYGGVIVVFHQLKALKACGLKVILHAYQYGDRTPQQQLEEICEEVHYYKRSTGWKAALSNLPYIVNSRKSNELLTRLLEDDYPILFEGVHTTAWIDHPDLAHRKKAVRMHNIEWRYYESLYDLSRDPLRKSYFLVEAKRLKKYDEHVVLHADVVLTISENDQKHYHTKHQACHLMPAPHGENFEPQQGIGDYFLYHAKLSVEDNKMAALFLMNEVFTKTNVRLVIAGMDPDMALKKLADTMPNVSLVANPSDAEMRKLIKEAQANILYTFQDNGLKLKLLHALHLGRHCIVNEWMVSNTVRLRELCTVATDSQSLIQAIEELKEVPFSKEAMEKRQKILEQNFNNLRNTKEMLNFLKKHGFS